MKCAISNLKKKGKLPIPTRNAILTISNQLRIQTRRQILNLRKKKLIIISIIEIKAETKTWHF